MVQNKIVKKFLGTAKYMASLTFYHTRKHYNAQLKVSIEIFDGRNRDAKFECYNIAEVGKKVMDFYREKIGHDIEIRRLARWFLEYLEEAGVTPPEMSILIRDLQSTPAELEARYGKPFPYKDASEKEKHDDDEDELEEAIEEVAEDIEEAGEEISEEEIIEEVIEEVVEEILEDAVEDVVDEAIVEDDDIIEDVVEEIAEEVTEGIAEELTEDEPVTEETAEVVEEHIEKTTEETEEQVPVVPVIEEPIEETTSEVDELEDAFEEFADDEDN